MTVEGARQCAKDRKDGEPWYIYVTESVSRGNFCLALCSFVPPSRAPGYHLEWGGMPLHDADWINCKKGVINY